MLFKLYTGYSKCFGIVYFFPQYERYNRCIIRFDEPVLRNQISLNFEERRTGFFVYKFIWIKNLLVGNLEGCSFFIWNTYRFQFKMNNFNKKRFWYYSNFWKKVVVIISHLKTKWTSKIMSIFIQIVSSEISSFGNGSKPSWIEKRVPVSLSYLSGWEIADIWRPEVPFFRYFREPRVPPYQLDAIFLVRFFIPPLWNIKSRFCRWFRFWRCVCL